MHIKDADIIFNIINNTYNIKYEGKFFRRDIGKNNIINKLNINTNIAVLASGNAKQIFLAGFDGYLTNFNKNEEINSIFSLFFKSAKNIKIESITPTLYQIPEKSLYDI